MAEANSIARTQNTTGMRERCYPTPPSLPQSPVVSGLAAACRAWSGPEGSWGPIGSWFSEYEGNQVYDGKATRDGALNSCMGDIEDDTTEEEKGRLMKAGQH